MTATQQVDQVLDFETELNIRKLAAAKAQLEDLQHEIEVLTMAIEAKVPKTAEFVAGDGVRWRATVVRGEHVQLNVDLLAARSPELYETCTKRVADTRAFKKALESGQISPSLAREVAQIVPKKPYVTYTQITQENTDDDAA